MRTIRARYWHCQRSRSGWNALDASKPTKALETNGAIKKGHFKLGLWGQGRGTPAQVVHDGDTVGLNTALNFSSRFLGIDAPEISFTIRTKDTFVGV